MKIKSLLKWHGDLHDRGKDDRSMGKDHREDKTKKDDVEHGVVMRTGSKKIRKSNIDGESQMNGSDFLNVILL